MFTKEIIECITTATAKALATNGPEGINVVPVSTVSVTPESIILHDFFMGKTILNIETNNNVSLACWSGLSGVQIKAKATYVTAGNEFEQAVILMKEKFPTRVLKGLVTLLPTTVYDVSADSDYGFSTTITEVGGVG